jgi:arylsulfatase
VSGNQFQGRTVQPITGRTWVPWLTGKAERVYGPGDAVGEELFGSRFLRQGDWKITDIGDGTWRLFDLANDPGETRDLAAEQPGKLAALAAAWQGYAHDNGVILPTEATYRP